MSSDFDIYNFTIKEKDLIQTLHNAVRNGCTPLIYYNGMFFDIELEETEEDKT